MVKTTLLNVAPFLIIVVTFLSSGDYFVNGANILFVQDIPWRSHFVWNFALAEGLLKRGHNVTMLGPDAYLKGSDNENYHPVILEAVHKKVDNQFKSLHLKTLGPLEHLKKSLEYACDVCSYTYQSKGFQKVWKSEDLTFDLIIIDISLGQCMYPLVEKFNFPPTIGVSAHKFSPGMARLFGNDIYPAYVPHPQLNNYTENMSFWDRTWNYIYTNTDLYIQQNYKLNILQKLAERMLSVTFDFRTIDEHVSLFLANHNPLIDLPQPLSPNVIPVGGIHVKINESMHAILNSILNNAGTGFILCSLGGNINVTTSISLNKRKAFAEAFGRLNQKTVIWKYDSEDGFDVPNNVMTHTWLPQNAVLGHPNAALLITNGGLLSLQEAAFHGVPFIAIPFTAEQRSNVQTFVDKKLGIKLELEDISEDSLYETIMEILKDEVYLSNAKAFSARLNGQSTYLLQKAVFWAEYAMVHNGAKFLIPRSRYISYFVSTSKDVEIFLLLLSLPLLFFLILFVKILSKCLCKQKSKNQPNKKKTN